MKFARYLGENTVPEWKKVYIQYRGLKKLIKRVAEHREARLRLEAEHGLARAPSGSSSTAVAGSSANAARRRRVAASNQEAQHTLASSPGYLQRNDYGGTHGPAPALPELPPVSLAGTGLRLSSDHFGQEDADETGGTQDLEAQASYTADTKASASQQQPLEATSPPRTTARYDLNADPSSPPPFTAAVGPSRKATTSSTSSKRQLVPRTTSSTRSLRAEPPASTLSELISTHFDSEESKLFSACDAELERIVAFYEAQEASAAKQFTQLARQLQELAEHRREYRAKYSISDHDRALNSARKNRVLQLLSSIPGTQLLTEEVVDRFKFLPGLKGKQTPAGEHPRFSIERQQQDSDDDAGDRRRTLALAAMQASLRGWDGETDSAIREANKAAAMSHDPEAYAAARKKLKAAVLEYYRFLETITNYKILNRTGFAKVMKKFSKTVNVACSDLYYRETVAPTILVTSDRIEKLGRATEDIYTAYFEHGNRKQALDRLRAREDHTTHHYSVFRSGFYLGISLCAVVAGLVEAMKPETQRRVPQWAAMLRVYGAEFIPTLFALGFGLNLAWWHAVRINTVFIFEWDVRSTMDHRQFFEIPALLMLLLSCCFWVSFVNLFPDTIYPTTWPTVWLVIAAVVMLNPLPILMPAGRWWFTRSLLRVLTAGCKRVQFRDFFLGDELNSVAWSISNFWYIGCEYHHNWAHPDRCWPNKTYWTSVLLSIPAVLRLGQCIRRWMDSEYRTHLHLVNAGKYCSAILNNFFYLHYRRKGSNAGVDQALWILFATIYSLWHIAWDLLMDWSLVKPRAKYLLLRNEISFPLPVYYVSIVIDVVGRSIWVIYLIPGRASVTLRSFLAALVEMGRRVCWNNLRVENEQIGNTDSFKILRDLPLPYRQKLIHQRELDPDRVHKGGIFSSVKLSALRKKSHPTAAADPTHHTEAHQGLDEEARDRDEMTGREERRKSWI
ncbi:related to putative phosphate transporter 1 [Ustilago sp. UG-2017b]|nr:related to putative phosphate transporter 1 [Ustilago sp. UG-2017b]